MFGLVGINPIKDIIKESFAPSGAYSPPFNINYMLVAWYYSSRSHYSSWVQPIMMKIGFSLGSNILGVSTRPRELPPPTSTKSIGFAPNAFLELLIYCLFAPRSSCASRVSRAPWPIFAIRNKHVISLAQTTRRSRAQLPYKCQGMWGMSYWKYTEVKSE